MIRWVTVFVDRPEDGFAAVRDFWLTATGTTLSPARGDHDEFATLVPADGDPCLRIQRTQDGSAGSHLDLHVDDVETAAVRAVGLGADAPAGNQPSGGVVTMRSPGGLAFCLVEHDGEHVRPSPFGEAGGRTLVDQASIDIAPDRFDSECRFWADLTGWNLRPGVEPEYAVLDRADGQPFRFLLQKRGADDAGHPTTCHLDLACDDIPSAVESHVELGARVVAEFPWWTVMADPVGTHYCLTRRNPDTGTHA